MTYAVVILNWNGKALLEKFLPALVKHSSEANLYVIDNASSDDSLHFLSEHYPEVSQIGLSDNFGFAKGYNEGLKQVKEQVWCLLNNDVEVTKNWLLPFKSAFEKTDVAIAQPHILQYKRKTHFEFAGAAGGFIDQFGYPYCRGRLFQSLEKNTGQYDATSDCFWASGACFFVRQSVWKELGGFDEDFFMHQEEIDFCWRAFNHHKKVQSIGASQVYHMGAASLEPSPQKTYYNHRNSLWMLLKNLPRQQLFSTLLIRLFLDGIAGVKYLAEGHFLSFLMVIKAHLSFYGKMKEMFKKRSEKVIKRDYFTQKSVIWSYFIIRKRKYSDLY